MDPALRLLLRLRFRAWIRRLWRNARTPKGLIVLVAGGLFMSMMCIQPIMLLFFDVQGKKGHPDPAAVLRFGTLGLFVYSLLMLATSIGEKAIAFSPAEINLLFPGPFSRRQLLGYKIGSSLFALPITALFMSLYFGRFGSWWPAAYCGLLFALFFMQFLGILVALIGQTVGAHAFSKGRQAVLVALLAVPLIALFGLRSEIGAKEPLELLKLLEQSPLVQVVLSPYRWFAETFAATQLWPDFTLGALRCLAVVALELLLIFGLDAHYLETAATNSEKLYEKLQRLRSGNASAWTMNRSAKAKWSLPMLPRFGGIGPLAWRQFLAALRGGSGILIVFAIMSAFSIVPVLLADAQEGSKDSSVPYSIGGTTLGMTLFIVLPMLLYDFRGDLDRMDVLKSLPLSPLRIVIGQITAPVVLLTLLQTTMAVVLQLARGGVGWMVSRKP